MERQKKTWKSGPILKLIDLVKVYTPRGEHITAVDHVSLDVNRGEIFSLLGPNGAGKTTALRMISTLETPTDGGLVVDGYNVVENPPKVREKIGLVPQEKGFYEKLTAWETMDMMGTLYDVSEDLLDERIESLLRLVDLWDRRNSLVGEFSGGMKQRLSLASGLIHHPSLLLLDEPTTGLDPHTRRKLWDLVLDLNEEGVTIFINTHIMEEAETLSDRVGIMNRGRLVEVDTPGNLKRLVRGGETIEITVGDDNMDRALNLLKEKSTVRNARVKDGSLELVTEDRRKALSELPQLLSDNGIEVLGVEVVEPTLEDAFIQITTGDLE